jgi:hypothetical protein
VEVLRSALRHGVDSQEIHHALGNALLVEEIGEDPTRYLVLGPDQVGEDAHRAKYRRLLSGDR